MRLIRACTARAALGSREGRGPAPGERWVVSGGQVQRARPGALVGLGAVEGAGGAVGSGPFPSLAGGQFRSCPGCCV